MARTDPQMNLRVPVELKEKIERAAFENNRTITAEAVSRLENSFITQLPVNLEDMPILDAFGILSELCEKKGFQFIVFNKSALTPDKDGYVKIKVNHDSEE